MDRTADGAADMNTKTPDSLDLAVDDAMSLADQLSGGDLSPYRRRALPRVREGFQVPGLRRDVAR